MTTTDDRPPGAGPSGLPVATAVRAPGPGSRRLGLTFPAIVVGSLLVLGGVVLWKTGGGGGDDHADDDDDDHAGLFEKKRDDTGAVLKQLERMKDRLCACKDQACADDVMADISSLAPRGGKPSKAQMERAMKISEEMADCQRRLMGLDAPPDLEADE